MGAQEQEQEQAPAEGECGAVVKRRKSADATEVSMELDILDCPVCYNPLRPPIFQCAVGHVVCSSCCVKLPDRCHCCSITIESTKVPCFYGNLGCAEKMTYYEKEDHQKVCPHAPCFCPEAGCHFRGSTLTQLDHFTAVHKWHSARVSYNKAFQIRIAQGSTILHGEYGSLFLVNMVPDPLGGVISVFCIQPHVAEPSFKCKLSVSCPEMSYAQVTQFQARSTNLSDGLPKDCSIFVVPKAVLRDTGTNVTAMVSMTLISTVREGGSRTGYAALMCTMQLLARS